MTVKQPQRDRDPGREVVRAAQLGKVLTDLNDALNHDMGVKTVLTLAKFHSQKVDPRFKRLERLPWNWVALRLWDLVDWIVGQVKKRIDIRKAKSMPEPEKAPASESPA